MAGGMLGLDPQRLRSEFIPKLDTAVSDVRNLMLSVDGAVNSMIGQGLAWNGDDAEKFREQWNLEKSKLQNVIDTLNDAKSKVNSNITEQETGSGGSGGQFNVV